MFINLTTYCVLRHDIIIYYLKYIIIKITINALVNFLKLQFLIV